MARKKIIAGNWKMNMTPSQAVEFVNSIKDKCKSDNEVVFCVPYVSLNGVSEALKGTDIALGAQNMHFEESGAYTGEISASMLSEIGVKYVIVGHSERRQYFSETDITVNKKAIKVLQSAMTPIICVGETIEEREQGITVDLIRKQVKIAFIHLNSGDAKRCVVAYEPIWAIGTGKTASSLQAEEVCAAIRQVLSEIYDKDTADEIRILYGGSVNAKNAAELFSMDNIDGGLVGGASIKPEFEIIAKA